MSIFNLPSRLRDEARTFSSYAFTPPLVNPLMNFF